MTDKINEEMALVEFNRWCEAWDIDCDTDGMKEKELENFEDLSRKLGRMIRLGRLTVGDDGDPTYHLKYAGEAGFETLEALTFRIPDGSAMATWDKFKPNQSVGKLNSYLGNMTKQSPQVFIKMDNRDLLVCQAVVTLFLAS